MRADPSAVANSSAVVNSSAVAGAADPGTAGARRPATPGGDDLRSLLVCRVPGARVPDPGRGALGRGTLEVGTVGGCPPGQARGAGPLRDAVHGGSGEDEEGKEAGEEQDRHRAVDTHPGGEWAGGEEPEDAARGADGLGAIGRLGDALGNVDQSAGGGRQEGNPHREPRGCRRRTLGAEEPDTESEEDEGDDVADLPDGPRDDGVDEGAESPRQSPPLAGGDGHGKGDQQQAQPVAAVLGLKVEAADPAHPDANESGAAPSHRADSTQCPGRKPGAERAAG